MVIAVFYSGGISFPALLVAGLLLAVMAGLRAAGVVWLPAYVLLGAGVWLAVYESGVHATIAGAVLGLLAPARPLAAAATAREWASDLSDEPSRPSSGPWPTWPSRACRWPSGSSTSCTR